MNTPIFRDATEYLAVQGLGSPERSHFTTQIISPGPGRFQTLINLALSTKNKVLGAVLLSHYERVGMASKSGVRLSEFVDALVGDEFRKWKAGNEPVTKKPSVKTEESTPVV